MLPNSLTPYGGEVESRRVKVHQRSWLFPELLKSYRFKVLYGGRGGAKSWAIAQALLHIASQKPAFIVCAREIQKSIKESVKKLLEDEIKRLGWQHLFISTLTEIVGLNGSRFSFVGLRHDPDGVKSLEGANYVWVEEAQSISSDNLETLIPTIRAAGSEIWFSFNPRAETDAVYQRFIVNKDARALCIKVNYYDNPFLPDELLQEAMLCRKLFPLRYRAIWLGEVGVTEFQMLRPDWWPRYINLAQVEARVTHKYITADTAFESGKENDYTAMQCWGAEGKKRLYLLDEIFGKWEFPELVANARKFWRKHSDAANGRQVKEFWIEKKASGHSLIQTLRREQIRARGWSPKAFDFPDNKIAGFKEMSWLVAPHPDSEYGTGDVWIPDDSIYAGGQSFIDHCAAISEDETHEYDDRGDAAKIAVSVWRKMGGGRDRSKRAA